MPVLAWHASMLTFVCCLCTTLRRLLIGAVGAFSLLPAALSQEAEELPGRAPLAVDDILKLEAIGAAAFTPDGRYLVYNLVPPYDEIGDYSYWMTARGLSGHRAWVLDMAHEGDAQALAGLDATASNYLFGFSPDSRHAVFIRHSLGRLSLVTCGLESGSCHDFGAMPDIRDRYAGSIPWNERLIWVSNTEFVMPVRDSNQPGSEMRSRAISGQFLWEQWNNAWRGVVPTSSVAVSTGRDRSEDWANGTLARFNVETGAQATVRPGRYAGVQASPDGKYVTAAKVGERQRPPSRDPASRDVTHPTFDRRYALTVIDLQTGEETMIGFPHDIDPDSIAWAVGSDAFAVYGWGASEGPAEGRFHSVTLAATVTTAHEPEGFELVGKRLTTGMPRDHGAARALMLSSGIAVFAKRRDAKTSSWYQFGLDGMVTDMADGLEGVSGTPLYADEDGLIVIAKGNLYRIGPGQPPQALLAEAYEHLEPLRYRINLEHAWANEFRFNWEWSRNSFSPVGYLTARMPGDVGAEELLAVDYRTGRVGAVFALDEAAAPLAASLIAGAVAYTRREGASTALVLQAHGKPRRELAAVNRHLDLVSPPTQRTVALTGRGLEASRDHIPVCVLLPEGPMPEGGYPAVIEVYPIERLETCRTFTEALDSSILVPDLWPARGFAYLRLAVPLNEARQLDGSLPGLEQAVRQAVKDLEREEIIDPERVVLLGFSQGGPLALELAARTDTFAAVISINGWANYLSHYFGARGLMRYFHLDQNGGDNRWRYECQREVDGARCPFGFGVTPFVDAGIYAASSPVTLATNVTAPILLVHSDFDYIDMAQFDEMFGALYRAGKEATYVRYWGEGHGPSSPANIRDLWARMDRFLADHGLSALSSSEGAECPIN